MAGDEGGSQEGEGEEPLEGEGAVLEVQMFLMRLCLQVEPIFVVMQ